MNEKPGMFEDVQEMVTKLLAFWIGSCVIIFIYILLPALLIGLFISIMGG